MDHFRRRPGGPAGKLGSSTKGSPIGRNIVRDAKTGQFSKAGTRFDTSTGLPGYNLAKTGSSALKPGARTDADARFRRPKSLRVLNRATIIFGSQSAATDWMFNPSAWLDGRKPYDLLADAEGLLRVETYLGQIEHGVYV